MQEQTPDTVLEQQPAAAEPEAQAQAPAEDTQQPAEAAAPAKEEAPAQPEEPAAVTVVDIRFRNNAKSYYFDPAGLTLTAGAHVIIDTARGDEFGVCAAGNHPVKPRELVLPLRRVLRVATEQDERTNAENQEKEKKAFEICQQKIAAHGLEMQLVSAECAFDGSKLLFFFTADGRVDFRELVKDLASAFRTRIELRQIGVRDKAKMVGGLGVCGRPFCCKEFLDDFQPVSIKMAKTQNLSLNPTKISGTCGRLMCCLKYEQEAYEDLLRTAPKTESFVDTPEGRGTVVEVDLLRQRVKVRMEDAPDTISVFPNSDIAVLRNGKARKNDPPIPPDLAPISGSGKRAHKEAEEEPVHLEAIRFRYSTETVADDTEQPAESTAPAEQPKESRPVRPRGRRRGNAEGGKQEQPGEKKDTVNRPETGETAQPAEGGTQTKRPRRRNGYRRSRRPGSAGQAEH